MLLVVGMPVFGKLTAVGASKLLNEVFGGTPMNVPSAWYAGYTVGTSSRESVGAEPMGNGYQRVALPNTTASWSTPALQTVSNLLPIQWENATGNHGAIQSIVLYDSPSGGNPLVYFPLQSPKEIQSADAMFIPAGALSIEFETGLFSNTIKNRLLAAIFGGVGMTIPSTYWMGYCTSAPTDAAPGTEPTGNGYSRISIPNTTGAWPPSATGQKTNGVDFLFPEATANQGQSVGFALFDAPSGGNYIAYHPSDTIALNTGVIPYIASGSIRFEVR